MHIIRAQIEDAALLARIHVDSFRAAYRGLLPDSHLERFTYAFREEHFRAALAASTKETYLVLQDEEPIGILTLGAARDSDLDGKTGEIWGIYLAPSHWRKRIGTKVVRHAETMLRARGYETIVLWVLDKNPQGRSFYEALGFAADGASKTVDWGVPLTAVRYRQVVAVGPSGTAHDRDAGPDRPAVKD